MVKSTMTETVPYWGRGGTAAAMAQNEQATEEHSTLEQQSPERHNDATALAGYATMMTMTMNGGKGMRTEREWGMEGRERNLEGCHNILDICRCSCGAWWVAVLEDVRVRPSTPRAVLRRPRRTSTSGAQLPRARETGNTSTLLRRTVSVQCIHRVTVT